ncbi:MAG: hypothetical protein JWM21_2583 [Acidobacteria bacterium]|nr:hypothetical protein [Acidobacteriota bacterium]
MKKILALVTFLIVAAACSTEPPAGPTSNANNATPATSTTLSEADAIAKEKATWDAIKKKDYEAFGNMLTSDYIEVGGDGVYDKAGIVAYVKDLALTDVTYADWKLLPVDKDAVILTYNVTIKGTFKNAAIPPGPYRASSAWVNRDGKWLAIFYQETLPKTGPSAASPAATPAAKSAATPAAKAAEVTTGPDAEANDKLVWQAIKSKNYDAFGAMLAPDAVEIEADGVYDKAGSVKGVSMFDPSKFELSAWKTTKFDSDASLVTYLVTMPGPKPSQERHSTIWVNRAGKWLALFHQGSPVEAPASSPAAKPAASVKPASK